MNKSEIEKMAEELYPLNSPPCMIGKTEGTLRERAAFITGYNKATSELQTLQANIEFRDDIIDGLKKALEAVKEKLKKDKKK